MPGNRRRARAENALFAAGIIAVLLILVPVILGGRADIAEMIGWAISTTGLLFATRVQRRTIAVQRETIDRLNRQLRMPDTRKCAACDYSGSWFTVLMHEGAVHGL